MVDEELGRDLLSFGQPVLVLGDPAQLPPVKGGGFFTEGEPDVMLTEVHRQAKDNPIIHLSMMVREGGRLETGSYGESRIIRRREIDAAAVMAADQVLVGLNKTRRLYNTRLRELNGYRDPMPAAGEKLVCLRNDKTKGLLNGGTWTHPGPARHPQRLHPHGRAARRRCPPPVRGGVGAQGLLRGHRGGGARSSCARNRTSSPTATR